MGAVGLAILQYLTSFLLAQFSGSPSALLFGPVIAVMVFFNLFSQLILFIAAWIVTDRDEAVDLDSNEAAVQQVAPPAEGSDHDDAPAMVSQNVAARSVRAGMRAGYVTGAATGAGVGAAFAFLLSAFRGRGRSKDKSS